MVRSKFALLLISWLLATTVASAQCPSLPPGGIVSFAPALSSPRREISVVTIGTKIFVLGDFNYSPENNRFSSFDTSTQVWTDLAPIPTGRGQGAAAVHDGKIYYFCGNSCFSNCWLTIVQVYDPATNTWESRTSMPNDGRGYMPAITIGDLIYVIGGENSYLGSFSDVLIYNPIADSWSAGTPMPIESRGHHTGVEFEGRIYLFGGFDDAASGCAGGDTVLSNIDVYDPTLEGTIVGPWTTVGQIPDEIAGLGQRAVTLNGRIYLLGGNHFPAGSDLCSTSTLGTLETVFEYNPASNCWRQMNSLSVSRWDHGAAAVGEDIYVVGGSSFGAAGTPSIPDLDSVEVFRPTPLYSVELGDVSQTVCSDTATTHISIPIRWDELLGVASEITAVSLRIVFDASILEFLDSTFDPAIVDAEPIFMDRQTCGDVITVAMVANPAQPFASPSQEFIRLEFLAHTALSAGNSLTTEIFALAGMSCNGVTINNEVVVGTTSHSPQIEDSTVTLSAENCFVRGECNGSLSISSAVFLLVYLLAGGATPTCLDACDSNDDGNLNLADPLYSLMYMFVPGSPPPVSPFPSCGLDPSPDGLECAAFVGCP
ncbi:MAG: hypothetical protein ACKVX7_15840 [Planctomycetota bacterium]